MRRTTRALFDKLGAQLEALARTDYTAEPDPETSPFGVALRPHSGLLQSFHPEGQEGLTAHTETKTAPFALSPSGLKRRPKSRNLRKDHPARKRASHHEPTGFTPQDMGLLAWTGDPIHLISSVALTPGVIYLARLRLFQPLTVSRIYTYLSYLYEGSHRNPSAQICCGIYNEADLIVARSPLANDLEATAAGGPKAFDLQEPIRLTPGLYTLALHYTGGIGRVTLLTGPLYRDFAFLLHSEKYRFAESKIPFGDLPQLLRWSDFTPGLSYWFGLGK